MARTDTFLTILFIHLVFRRAYEIAIAGVAGWPLLSLVVLALGLAAFVSKAGIRFRLAAIVSALAVAGADLVLGFPFTDNHAFVEFFCLLLAAACHGTKGRDADLLERSLGFVLAWVFIHAGWQKVAYGAYFDGSFLLSMAGDHENFRSVVELVLGTEARAVLASQGAEGPFRVDSVPLLILSNGIYLSELAAGGLLLFGRTRNAGLALLVCVLLAIEWVARELVFGLLCLNLALLQVRGRWAERRERWAVPAFAGAYLLLLVSATGALWEFHFK